jgi:hypothetical protein
MSDARKLFRFHRTLTADGKIHVHKGTHRLAEFVFTLSGPASPEPAFPDHPITRAEFYALMSEFAARGYWDNLLATSIPLTQ